MEGSAVYPIFVVVMIAFYPICLSKPTTSTNGKSSPPSVPTSKTLLQNATDRWKQEKCEITPKKVGINGQDHEDDVTTVGVDYNWLRHCNLSTKALGLPESKLALNLCQDLIGLSTAICSNMSNTADEKRNQMMKIVASALNNLVQEEAKTDICSLFKKLQPASEVKEKKLASLTKQYKTLEHLVFLRLRCINFCKGDGKNACKYFYILTSVSLGLPLPSPKGKESADPPKKNSERPPAVISTQPSVPMSKQDKDTRLPNITDDKDGSRASGEAATIGGNTLGLPQKGNNSPLSDGSRGYTADKGKSGIADKQSTTGTLSVNESGLTSRKSSSGAAMNKSTVGTLKPTQATSVSDIGENPKTAGRKTPSPERTGNTSTKVNPVEMPDKQQNTTHTHLDKMLKPTTKSAMPPPLLSAPLNTTAKTNTGLKSTTTTATTKEVMTTSTKKTPIKLASTSLKPAQEVMTTSTQKTPNELDIKTTILTTLSTKDILSDGDIEPEDESSYSDEIALDGGQFNGGGGFLGTTQEKNEDVPLEPIFEGTGKTNPFLDTKQETRINPIVPKQEVESSHFMAYFLTIVVVCIVGYVLFHNKQKIIAFILEGRGNQRRRGTGGAEYQKVSTNVDEALPAADKKVTTQNYIY